MLALILQIAFYKINNQSYPYGIHPIKIYNPRKPRTLKNLKEIWLYLEFLKRLVYSIATFLSHCRIARTYEITSWFLLWIVVQSLRYVRHFVNLWMATQQASLSFAISWSLLKFMSIESMMPSNHLILCHPLLLQPSIFPSIRIFSNELALCIMWPNYWSFISFNIQHIKLKGSFLILPTMIV